MIRLQKIILPFKIRQSVLALGSQTKNTLCFAHDGSAFLSTIHADLLNPADLQAFKRTAAHFLKNHPKVIAYDLHPEYVSSRFVSQLKTAGCRLQAIQHHHAHIASCMADNNLANQKVIGVAFDGTGYGSDGTLWGAEFLVCDYTKFDRKAHLKYLPLLGAEKAIQQPWRLAAAWLYAIYQEKFLRLGIDFTKDISKKKWEMLERMYVLGFNSPLASSMGRLFDAVATLVLGKYEVQREGELAVELEKIAVRHRLPVSAYRFRIRQQEDAYIVDPSPMFTQIITDIKHDEPKAAIAKRFHITVAQMIHRVCTMVRKECGIDRVVLSGGVFQNKLLLGQSLDLLYREHFTVFVHRKLSCNDSGISLGQAVIASLKG